MSARTDNRKESWTETTLGQLNGERGQTIEPAKTPDKQFELYSVPIYPTAKPEVVKGREIGSNKQMVEPRSVLLCKINPHINRVWVVGDFTTYTKIASTEWIVFPLTEEIHPEFLCYFLQQYAVRDFLAHNASGVGGSLMRVKPSTIRDYPFAYPRLLSQRGIVAEIEKRFTRLDAGVAALRRVQANLKRYRAAVLKAACEGRLLSTTGSVSFQPLMDLIEGLGQGWSPKCDLHREPDQDEWAIITTTAVQPLKYVDNQGKPLPANLSPRPHLEIRQGDFLMTRKGPRHRTGVACLVRSTRHRLMVCDTVYRFRCRESRVTAAFLELALNSPPVVEEINRRKSGISDSGISLTHFKIGGVPIPLPPISEQKRIVVEVERRLSVVEELEVLVQTNLQRAARLRQAILQKAFTGEIL